MERRVRANDPEQLDHYKSNLLRLIKFLDGTDYPKEYEFTDDKLGTLHLIDIQFWFLATIAFGKDDPRPDNNPIHMRASSLEYCKKSIS